MRIHPLAAPVLLALAAAPSAQVTWTDLLPATSPQARHRAAMAPFPGGAGNEHVMFGGAALPGGVLQETWKWDGATWTQLSLANSPRVLAPSAGLHAPTNEVVSFSGWNGNSYVPETFVFDGVLWTSSTPSPSPPPRDWGQLVYDPTSGTSILFGGHDWQQWFATGGNYGDTWGWTGSAWVQYGPATSPPGRARHALCWDGATGSVILIGGTSTQDMTTGGLFNDMWSWDGADWKQLFPAALPPPRNEPSMVWDPARNVVVLHGGVDGSIGTVYQDTWEWDGATWTQVTPAPAGPATSGACMGFDAVTGDMVHFGGASAVDLSAGSDKTHAYTAAVVWADLGFALAGASGAPQLVGSGKPVGGNTLKFTASQVLPSAQGFLVAGLSPANLPLFGGTLVPFPNEVVVGFDADPGGEIEVSHTLAATTAPGIPVYLQAWFVDASGPQGLTATNGIFAATE